MQRILVIGSGGAGKSTVARELAAILDLPLIHLDAEYWRPGWTKPPAEWWTIRVDALVARPKWVMDGNYGGTLDRRLGRSDAVILLDLPRTVCLWRVLKRWIRYVGRTRPDVAPGSPERLTWEFVKWIWNYPSKSLPGILQRLDRTGPDQRVVILSSTRQVKDFLAEVSAERKLRDVSRSLATSTQQPSRSR
jgi:adenylate kinase family enzyme